MKGFVRVSSSGQTGSMIGADWLDQVLEPSMTDQVPHGVQALLEVARGAHAYGYFFYPLYTLAAEQLYRVAEAAISQRCKLHEGSSSPKRFLDTIDWLADQKVISEEDRVYWHAIRKLRNSASHPERQMIITPAMALGSLSQIVEKINILFADA